MAKYIEREAALDIVNGWRDQLIPTYGKNDEYVKCLETVAEHLESLHVADVHPVVLCRDCYAYRRGKELAEAAYLDPKMYCGLLRCEMGEDGFCSYGKRKGEKS